MAKILILDDEKELAFTFGAILEMEGYEVLTAEKGSEAENILKTEKIDAAFVDLHLPDMDGMAVVKLIKKMSPDTKVGIMSGDHSPELEKTAHENGASWFFAKPADPKVVLGVLQNDLLS
jgi:DNA-binding response OmpR family regulator